MTSPRFLGSRVAFWLVAPWVVLGAVAFGLVGRGMFEAGKMTEGFLAAYFGLLCLVGLYAMMTPKHGLLCGRFIAATIGAGYIAYFVLAALIEKQSLLPTGRPADASPFNAILGFFFIGLPCLLFAFTGRPFWGSFAGGKGEVTAEPELEEDEESEGGEALGKTIKGDEPEMAEERKR